MASPRVGGYGYQPNTTTDYRRFSADYFSGADVRIYFGDIWVDEITNLQFSLQENVAPIYGYASYTYDRIARGTRVIQGSFNINFKESYYLHSVLQRLESKMEGEGSDAGHQFQLDQFQKDMTVEQLIREVDGQNFGVIADQFEKAIWGGETTKEIKSRMEGRKHYGPFFNSDPVSGTVSKMADVGFNILIAYGPLNQKDGRKYQETVHSLIGVQLTGVNQIVGLDGRPVEEQYSFIARDLDNNASGAFGSVVSTKPVLRGGHGHAVEVE